MLPRRAFCNGLSSVARPDGVAYAVAMGGIRRRWGMGALVLLVAAVGSCGSSTDEPETADERAAAVYQSILGWVLDEELGASVDEAPEWVLFVGSRSETPVDLDVQVAVVAALEPRVFVRFIDERSEAVEVDNEQEPVRESGMLVGLGAVPEDGETIEVYVDLYRHAGDVEAWLVKLRRVRTRWEIAGTPSPADVRPAPSEG